MTAEHITDQNFSEKVLNAKGTVLVDFYAEWCGPCQMMAPTIDELAIEVNGKALVYKLNVDENSETSGKYQVMSIPTLILFKDGQPVEKMVGVQSKETLKAKLG